MSSMWTVALKKSSCFCPASPLFSFLYGLKRFSEADFSKHVTIIIFLLTPLFYKNLQKFTTLKILFSKK